MNKKRFSQSCVAVMLMLMIGLLVMPVLVARADVGPSPASPGGSSVEPEGEIQTNVRMVSEQVSLTIEPYERPVPPGRYDYSPAYWMRAKVIAQFVLRNLGEKQESFDVWFPLSASSRYGEELTYDRSEHTDNIIQDFKVWVAEKLVATQQVQGPDLSAADKESPWAKFPVVFPVQQNVNVRVVYTVYPSGRRPFGDFEYILQTGAGWKDSIGEATITITLPDPITPDNVSFGGKVIQGIPYTAPHPDGYTVENNTITWHFTGLEPTAKDNIIIDVLEPQRYKSLLEARAWVKTSPNSTEAQLALARASGQAVLIIKNVADNGGGKVMAQAANSAYERAIELSPERAELYSEYAGWLMGQGYGWQLFAGGPCQPILCDLVQRGLEKFPDDPKLMKIDEDIQAMLADTALNATLNAHQTPSLTPTAKPEPATATATANAATTATAIATSTASPIVNSTTTRLIVQPTQTVAPTTTALPAPISAGRQGLWLAVLIPLVVLVGLGAVIYYLRRRST